MLVVLVMLPILGPHVDMLLEEKRFIREIEADRVVSELYAELLENGFYQQNISWNIIENQIPQPVDDPRLKKIGYDGEVNFAIKSRQRGEIGNNIRNYLVSITYQLTPRKQGRPLEFYYLLAVQHPGEWTIPDEEENELPVTEVTDEETETKA